MTTYKIKFNIEGGNSVELDLDKEKFEQISALCDQVLPDKDWKTETFVLDFDARLTERRWRDDSNR